MDKVYFAAVDWSEQGRQLAWYVINRSQAQAKVLVYDAPNQAVNARVAGFKEVLEGECSTCSIVATSTVDQSELAKPGPPTFVADMAKYPEGTLTDVADPFDSIGVPMMKTLKASGRTDVTVSGYDSTIEGINAMINNSLPIGGSMALPWSFAAYAGVDAVARAKAGAPAYDATALPTVLITKNNASKFTTSYYQPEGFPADFLKSWGKS
jgi:ABC-type sugar transport system substrate-binding protein